MADGEFEDQEGQVAAAAADGPLMASAGAAEVEATENWFTKGPVELLYYKVNRRPIGGDPSLFQPPDDVIDHLRLVLGMSKPAKSGARFQREWRLGNLEFDEDAGTFTGHLGWARSSEALGQIWDDDTHEWVDRIVPREDSAVAPVAFTLEGRTLGILKHPSFATEEVLDDVLSEILNRGERELDFPSTVWAVESLGDEGDFLQWLDDVDQLTRLTMVFQRPNPDGEEAFQELFDRLDNMQAAIIREEIVARDPETGLVKEAVKRDSIAQAFIAAAMSAFGRIVAKGRKDGSPVKYDQRQRVLRESLDSVGSDWDEATETVLRAVEAQGRSRGRDGNH
jgi:hypothetical protein